MPYQKVVVTGAAGRLGQAAITELLAHGHGVWGIDCVRPETLRCRFLPVDLTQPLAVLDALQGADAVLHLGAIPGPQSQPASVTFTNNVLSTYNVIEAAAALKIGRVVSASSVFALGWAEEAAAFWPETVPVDESHPLTPFEAYGLSKQIGEDICAATSRRTGMSIVSLRLMNIIQIDGYFALPWPRPTRDRGLRFVMWPYVDMRDAARSCRLALEAHTTGHEALFIAATDTRFDAPTVELLKEVAPTTVRVTGPLP
ncbi:MAG: NAD-dependent epimerase/dehydratase, partial [Planctomycetaceae bacterium]|nr:NAD-dependent epimerase/dehydratase [Planctomycetaceae bacterium]